MTVLAPSVAAATAVQVEGGQLEEQAAGFWCLARMD